MDFYVLREDTLEDIKAVRHRYLESHSRVCGCMCVCMCNIIYDKICKKECVCKGRRRVRFGDKCVYRGSDEMMLCGVGEVASMASR